jgi:hypothetical protein
MDQRWRSSEEAIPWISDMVSADVALWAHGPLPHPLVSYAPYLSIFVQVEVNYKHNNAHVMLFYLDLGGILMVKLGV